MYVSRENQMKSRLGLPQYAFLWKLYFLQSIWDKTTKLCVSFEKFLKFLTKYFLWSWATTFASIFPQIWANFCYISSKIKILVWSLIDPIQWVYRSIDYRKKYILSNVCDCNSSLSNILNFWCQTYQNKR